jgi:6-phosphogluconolactonase
MSRRIEVLADPSVLANHVAEWMTTVAVSSKGPLRISLSGGSTPRMLYEALVSRALRSRFPWERAHWYWGDERFVPREHPDSNYRMAYEAMLCRAPVPPEQVFPVPIDGEPEAAALRYEQTLQRAYGSSELDPKRPLFDITLLGLGTDGHTASLLPGQPVLRERSRWVVAVPRGRTEVRITMTYPALESSRRVAFLVTGKDKAPVVRAVLSGRSRAPAARVKPVGELTWFLDRAAAGEAEP